jgi:DNA-binding transcriptional MerR regulator
MCTMEKAKLRPKKAVAARYGVTIRTINRWETSETLDFPKAVVINNRDYYQDDELDEFDRRCARRAAIISPSKAA